MTVARGVLYDWCLHKGKYDVEAAMKKYFREIIFPESSRKQNNRQTGLNLFKRLKITSQYHHNLLMSFRPKGEIL